MFKKYTYPLTVIFAFMLLTVTSGMFFKNYSHIQKQGGFTHKGARPPITINSIAGWMTFDYINRNFKIPDDYLKKELSITSGSYPRITVENEAFAQKVTVEDLISRIKSSIVQLSSSTNNRPQ
jgi:hypothetical protein